MAIADRRRIQDQGASQSVRPWNFAAMKFRAVMCLKHSMAVVVLPFLLIAALALISIGFGAGVALGPNGRG